jgi:cytochrome c-type biogenesis protein
VEISYPVAFLAGLVSFITPCVLPLVPVYLSILSGSSFDQMTGRGADMTDKERVDIHKRVIANALAFILGFTIIFMIAGVAAGSVGDWLLVVQSKYGSSLTNWLLVVFALVMVFLGMNMAGFYKPMFLNTEARFQMQKGKWGLVSSGLVGAAFAFGWTPCIGPILAPILAMAAESGSRGQGAALLLVYSLGLAIPFFLSALSVNGLIAFTNKMKHHFHTMEVIVGSLLILIGLVLGVLGVYGLTINKSGLDVVRERMNWLTEVTSGIEGSLMQEEEAVEDNGTTITTPDGEFEVTINEEVEDAENPDETQ